jgi:GTP-binding protein HflX
LEIFYNRDKSKEAKLQVELAKLKHQLPRIYGKGTVLSRLGGGLGTRGPGEKQLEVRKRLIKQRIFQITKELEEIRIMKKNQRKRRSSQKSDERIIKVALVGYTNAGKSTLLEVLTSRETKIADMLFSSLDTTTSSRKVDNKTKILFTDTIGFINKLPPEVVESFRATLDEISEADILLHVVDISNERWLDHIYSVKETIKDVLREEKPIIYTLNKADRIIEDLDELPSLPHPAFVDSPAVVISAEKRWNIESLISKIVEVSKKVGEHEISKIA